MGTVNFRSSLETVATLWLWLIIGLLPGETSYLPGVFYKCFLDNAGSITSN